MNSKEKKGFHKILAWQRAHERDEKPQRALKEQPEVYLAGDLPALTDLDFLYPPLPSAPSAPSAPSGPSVPSASSTKERV